MNQQTRTRRPFVALWLLLSTTGTALAADKAYMTQVSELLGIVAAPTYLRDACSRRVPGIRDALRAQHAAWRQQHARLLAAIDVQLRRADARTRRQHSPFTLADLDRAGARMMADRLDLLTPAESREACGTFGEFLREQDETMQATVPARLAALAAADRELAASEAAPTGK